MDVRLNPHMGTGPSGVAKVVVPAVMLKVISAEAVPAMTPTRTRQRKTPKSRIRTVAFIMVPLSLFEANYGLRWIDDCLGMLKDHKRQGATREDIICGQFLLGM